MESLEFLAAAAQFAAPKLAPVTPCREEQADPGQRERVLDEGCQTGTACSLPNVTARTADVLTNLNVELNR